MDSLVQNLAQGGGVGLLALFAAWAAWAICTRRLVWAKEISTLTEHCQNELKLKDEHHTDVCGRLEAQIATLNIDRDQWKDLALQLLQHAGRTHETTQEALKVAATVTGMTA